MLTKQRDTILLLIGFGLILLNIGFLILVTGPKNVRSITQLAPGLFGLILILISMALTEMKSGKKTAKEAAITVAIEMAMLGLFILIANSLRK